MRLRTTPDGFEDRVSDIRCRPPTSAPDRNRAPGFRRRSLTVANVRQNGCQLGCQNLCFRPTHGPELCDISSRNVGNDRFQFEISDPAALVVQNWVSLRSNYYMKYYRPAAGESLAGSRPTADRRPAKSAAGQPAAQNLTIEDAREASPLPTVLKTAGLASVTVPQRPSEFDWKVADSTVVRSRPLKSGKLAVILAVSLAGK